jgi:hypothetical protein
MHLQFDNHSDCWAAFQQLQRGIDTTYARQRKDAIRATLGALEKQTKLLEEGGEASTLDVDLSRPVHFQLSWTKSQWYKEWFLKSSRAMEKMEEELEAQRELQELNAPPTASESR